MENVAMEACDKWKDAQQVIQHDIRENGHA
jgi:hypothetical protein